MLTTIGANSYGQLSLGDTEDRTLPVRSTSHVSEVKQISGGGGHTVVLTCNGECFLCGNNNKGQLGMILDESLCLKQLSLPTTVMKVSCGWEHTLALTNNGDVFAWGSNSHGQAGLELDSSSPVKVEGFNGHPVRDVAAGIRHSLAVTDDGNVWTWGAEREVSWDGWKICRADRGGLISRGLLSCLFVYYATLHTASSQITIRSRQTWQVSEELKCRSVAAGAYHSLAITVHNRLFGWGDNKRGQLAIEPDKTAGTLMFSKPKEISWNSEKSTEVISCVASGWTHVLILLDGGDVYSWGRNVYCQLGRPSESDQTDGSRRMDMCWKPAKVPHLPKIDHIACGSEHNIALTANGEVYCWGWNEHGMCADGTEEDVQVPKQVATLDKFKTHVIGSGAGHCMVACS
ncbi:putative secretion-regulating guanine nucleotide exchange factor [Apostichopus japonicus]|uniref:Putative secretion-regulating guanine nucleotide exchange factor n=1 Tax=Stichopus japonicus TaxID=307972 RepID=A0A2G8JCT0_STIJA|nr:putative secretion-regulating guanine nucleotide exchange factor [Apostichopus japonicus]